MGALRRLVLVGRAAGGGAVMTQQHTPEWFKARWGRPGASDVWRIMSTSRGGQTRQRYLDEIVAQRRTTEVPSAELMSRPRPAALEWGIVQEAEARVRYSDVTGRLVEQVGFVMHPAGLQAGASPDGIIESVG